MAVIHGRVGRGDPMGATPVAGGIVFRTWAPSASSVAVVAGTGLPGSIAQVGWRPAAGDMLQPLGDGSWGGFLPGAGDGTPYLFFVIGPAGARWKRDPYARELTFSPPYPASYCLARSPESYPWHDRDWLPQAFSDMILYQLHVGTWWAVDQAGTDVRATRGGTFLDVASRVEYLDGLGINAVQLMPIQEFETPHSLGYNGTDLFSPEMRYCCTPEEVRWRLPLVNAALARHGAAPLTEAQLLPGINQLKLLVDLLHLAGIGIVFDLVFNHAFGHDRRGSFDGGSLWFYDQQVGPEPNRSLYFTDRVWIGPVFAYWQDWVCQFLIDNARSTVTEFHADGLRYDEISAVVNMGGDSGVTFAQRLSGTLRATRGSAIQIAEYWNGDRQRPVQAAPGGLGFDATLGDGLREALRSLLVQAQGGLSASLDVARVGTALTVRVGAAWQLDQCLENQDKTYAGHSDAARVPKLADGGNARSWYAQSRSRAATLILLTAPGIPALFMGEEVLEDKNWNDSPEFGGLIWWDGLAAPGEPAMRDFLRFCSDLTALRRGLPALRRGDLRVSQARGFERVVVAHRWIEGEGQDVVTIVSFDENPKHGYRVGLPFAGRWREAFNSDLYAGFPNAGTVGNGGWVDASGPGADGFAVSATVTLPANGGVVLVWG